MCVIAMMLALMMAVVVVMMDLYRRDMCQRCSRRRRSTKNVYLKLTPTWDWSAAAAPTRQPTQIETVNNAPPRFGKRP